MVKRKRDESELDPGSSSDEPADRSTKIRASRFKARTAQSIKSLHDALKLARGFERQKLGRRQKTAEKSKNQKELDRLKEEVTALKALELFKTAEKYLLKQYVRTKRIEEHPAFKLAYGKDVKLEAPTPGAQANVMGRLFNSNPVKQVMPRIMAGALETLSLEDFSALKPGTKSDAPKSKKDNDSKSDQQKKPEAKPQQQVKAKQASDDDEFEGFSDNEDKLPDPQESLSDDDQQEGDDDEEEEDDDDDFGMDLDQFNDRLASGSDDDSDAGSDSFIPELKVPPNGISKTPVPVYPDADDMSISPSPSPSRSPSPSPPPASKAKATKTKSSTPKDPPTSTTFLPSLSMGGYFSGSDSEPEDDAIPKARKNRRGQRARQLIAERKYGKQAKHILKQGEKQDQARWDTKRGAVAGPDPRRGPGSWKDRKNGGDRDAGRRPPSGSGSARPGKPMGRGPQTSGANEMGLGKMRNFGNGSFSGPAASNNSFGGAGAGAGASTDNKPMHPSWEAARKRKKEEGLGKFTGQKITFD